MQSFSEESLEDVKVISFGCLPVDTYAEKYYSITNYSKKPTTYRVSVTYILNNIDHVFNVFVPSSLIKPGESCDVKVTFRPNVVGQSFTDYYIIDDMEGNTYRLTVTGRCFGPEISLSKRKVKFVIYRNQHNEGSRLIPFTMVNTSAVDTIYQWLMPTAKKSNFRISTGNCGVIKAFESIISNVMFMGTALGLYAAELVCLVLNQEPLFLRVMATVMLPGNPCIDFKDHTFEKYWFQQTPSAHMMENSLSRLDYIPAASVFERYLDFGTGDVDDLSKNISQSLCVTNHYDVEGYIQWLADPDLIFIIDPVDCKIPAHESKMFLVRFRPTEKNEAYGYMMSGDYQYLKSLEDGTRKTMHTLFHIPCVGNTWSPCADRPTEWECRNEAPSELLCSVPWRRLLSNCGLKILGMCEVVLPPTVPCRTAFANFMLSNRLDIPMYFKFECPYGNNFSIMPMCGIVQSRGWQIITVALEPRSVGDYFETWDLLINKFHKTRVTLAGSAEISQVEIMSHGHSPAAHAMYEFPATITDAVSYCTAYFHNLTRMEIHMRVICNVDWLGADNSGMFVLPPKEIVKYHWWFFPKNPDVVYDTIVTCSCVCLIDGRPVGEPTELLVHIFGFSEYPDLKVLPKRTNLNDVVVGDSASVTLTLYNYGTCFFTSKLYGIISGMDDDWSHDRLQIEPAINSLRPNNHCPVTFTVTPDGAGPRQVDIKYTVLFRTEYDEIEEFQPITKTVCKIWYDGIYPTFKIKRAISVTCPVILSNHDVWNISNIAEELLGLPRYYSTSGMFEEARVDDFYKIIRKRTASMMQRVLPFYLQARREHGEIIEIFKILNRHHDVFDNFFNRDHNTLNRALHECRPKEPLRATIYGPDLCMRAGVTELIFVLGNIYNVPVPWTLRREKICECSMVEKPLGLSFYTKKHTCVHRPLVELSPLRGVVTRKCPELLHLKLRYELEGLSTLCYILTLPNQRTIHIFINVLATINTKGILTPLHRVVDDPEEHLAILDCGIVPINNLDPVVRIVWLYNPTDVFTTWRLLRGNAITPDATIRCLLYFAEVPPLGKLPIPFSFAPTEMIEYDVTFACSFGYDNEQIRVTGRGGLPNCIETRIDVPSYVELTIRSMYRREVVFLSTEHIVIPEMPTHSLTRELVSINNDTDHTMRFIWLPERISNIINIVMTPCWGVIQPKSTEWITMTVYTLQEPATFTTSVSCEVLDLTERRRYQRNELLRRNKIEKCHQEFIITEKGFYHPNINDSPPYVLDIEKPQPMYISLTVSVSSKGQRDGYKRVNLDKQWEHTPPYDLLSSDLVDFGGANMTSGNNMQMPDVIRIIDVLLWEALHSNMFKDQLKYYSKEEIPTHAQLIKRLEKPKLERLSRRVTSGICDAIVNKAVFNVYNLAPKREFEVIEAE